MGGRTDRWQSPGGLENRHACVARSFQFSLLRQVTEVVSALWHVFPLYIVFNFVRIMGGGRRLTQMLRYDKKVERTPDGWVSVGVAARRLNTIGCAFLRKHFVWAAACRDDRRVMVTRMSFRQAAAQTKCLRKNAPLTA